MSRNTVFAGIFTVALIAVLIFFAGLTWKILVLAPLSLLVFHMTGVRDRAIRRQIGLPEDD